MQKNGSDHPQMTPEEAAEGLGLIASSLPADLGLVVFLIADEGDRYEARVVASLPPSEYAVVVRNWLERYDRGEVGDLRWRP
jgi:hypothetical protein